jgi:hypothetical protein
MKSLSTLGSALILAILLSLSMPASPASATCRRVKTTLTEASWEINQSGVCGTRAGHDKEFANVNLSVVGATEGVYKCYEVEPGETGWFSGGTCTAPGMLPPEKKWVWAILYAFFCGAEEGALEGEDVHGANAKVRALISFETGLEAPLDLGLTPAH